MEVFTNRESVERIIFAVFHYLNVHRDDTPLKEFTHKDWGEPYIKFSCQILFLIYTIYYIVHQMSGDGKIRIPPPNL